MARPGMSTRLVRLPPIAAAKSVVIYGPDSFGGVHAYRIRASCSCRPADSVGGSIPGSGPRTRLGYRLRTFASATGPGRPNMLDSCPAHRRTTGGARP